MSTMLINRYTNYVSYSGEHILLLIGMYNNQPSPAWKNTTSILGWKRWNFSYLTWRPQSLLAHLKIMTIQVR